MVDRAPTHLSPGKIVITPGAQTAARESGERPYAYLWRHINGDWGDLTPEDRRANEEALNTGARLISAYVLRSGVRIWIITEAASEDGRRASTCILLPDEY